MGRIMGVEPMHNGATIRRVNHFTIFAIGRGNRNRTHINGFGDRCTTVVRSPYLLGFFIIPNILYFCKQFIIKFITIWTKENKTIYLKINGFIFFIYDFFFLERIFIKTYTPTNATAKIPNIKYFCHSWTKWLKK